MPQKPNHMIIKQLRTLFLTITLCLFFSTLIKAQVGVGTTNPRATLEVKESVNTIESPIFLVSAANDRSMSILQPDNSDNDDAFTFFTNNAFQFRTDANDALVIDSQGYVGVNTDNALAELHLAGAGSTLRIDYLNSTNNSLNNGTDPSVVMVDANGDLFLKESVDDFPVNDSDEDTFFNTAVTITNANGALVGANAYSTTITLTKKTLVEVVFWTNVSIRNFAGNPPTDDKPRIFGGIVTHEASGQEIVYSSSSYTNALNGTINSGDITTGFYTVGGNGFITLEPGTHTINLDIFAGGGSAITTPASAAQGYRTTFGANGLSRFQIVYHN